MCPATRKAVMIHELFHVEHHHTEKRLLALLTPWRIKKVCHTQEFDADASVANLGYGPALWLSLFTSNYKGGVIHPSSLERCQRLQNNPDFRIAPVKSYPAGFGVTDQGEVYVEAVSSKA